MVDPGSIAEGIMSGLGTHAIAKGDERNYLEEIYSILVSMRHFMEQYATPTLHDIYDVIPLYKVGFGPARMLQSEHRKFVRVLVTVPTAVLVSSILGSPFILTLPAPTPPNLWLPLDFPDGTMYALDNTATANQMNVYVRYTNDKP